MHIKTYYPERVVEHITQNNSKNIIFLPPASGNTNEDSDTENIPDNFDNDHVIVEPGAELEVDDFVNSSSETEEDDRQTPSKSRKRLTPKWKKDTILESK